LNPKNLLSDESSFHGSGIYQLNGIDCAKKYAGQTGKILEHDTKSAYIHLGITLHIQNSLNIFDRTAMLLGKGMM